MSDPFDRLPSARKLGAGRVALRDSKGESPSLRLVRLGRRTVEGSGQASPCPPLRCAQSAGAATAVECSAMSAASALLPAQAEAHRQRAIRLEYFTIGWNSLEALVALLAGFLAGSIALVGFGLDSIAETISGATLLWRLRQRGDFEFQAESRALRIVGLSFFALAAYVSYESLADLWFRRQPRESLLGIILAAVSLGVMPLLGRAKRRVANQLGSRALAADAMETYLCSYLSLVLLLGLGLNAWLGWWWADPLGGLAMVPLMVREGLEALRSGAG